MQVRTNILPIEHILFKFLFSGDTNEQEIRLNNQGNHQRTINNLNNVLVNNNLNLNNSFNGTNNLNTNNSLLICNNAQNSLIMASSTASPTSSTSTLQGLYFHMK